ncbi:MAG: PAS domain-containing protein [Burkholderiales bacterium]|nr:PAS domain-containing protein [Burkholderiales bacterium]
MVVPEISSPRAVEHAPDNRAFDERRSGIRIALAAGGCIGLLNMLLPSLLAPLAAPPVLDAVGGAQGTADRILLLAGLALSCTAGTGLLATHALQKLRDAGGALATLIVAVQCVLLAQGLSGNPFASASRPAGLHDPMPHVDANSLHLWGFTYPPSVMVALALFGTACAVLAAVRGRRRIAYWLSACGIAIAIVDLVGGMLTLDDLFLAYARWAMPWSTALGLIALGAGLIQASSASAAERAARPDRRIIYSAGWLITGLLGIAAISSFAMIKADLAQNLRTDRQHALASRAQLHDNWMQAALQDARTLSNQPELKQVVQRIRLRPQKRVDESDPSLAALLRPGVRAIMVFAAADTERSRTTVLAQAGAPEWIPAVRLPLRASDADLLWHRDAVLETRWRISSPGQAPVDIVVQSELSRLTASLLDDAGMPGGANWLCSVVRSQTRCLPNQRGQPATAAAEAATAKRNESGGKLYRGRNPEGEAIVATAVPVGDTGLALTLELPAREAYAQLRRYTLVAVPIMILLAVLATAILNYQVAPVATRLYRSERMATSANTALVSISEQLRASQERLTLITDNIPALISYLDRDLVYRFANAYYYEVLGRHPEEVVGHHLRDALGDAMFREVEPWCRQVLTGMPTEYQVSRTVDGVARHFTVCYLPDYDAEGRVQGFYSLSHDVTERKRAADALADSERRMRTITDNIPALISQFDTTERCRFANRRFLDYFDIPRERALGKTLRQLVGDENYRLMKDELDTAMAGLPVTFERALRVRGETRFVSTSLMPQFDGDGKVSGCYGLTQDLTARKAAEMGRMRSEERLRTITDNMPALIAYLDLNGRFQFANRTWEDWLGQRTNHLIGYQAATVLEHTGAEALLPQITLALQGERTEFETELILPRGSRHVRGTFLPHVDEESQLIGVYGMIHDISALKMIELKLSQLARYDSLTGMPNRNLLQDRLAAAMSRVRRERAAPRGAACLLAVLFLDLDRFKEINDTLGHAAGDDVLKQFALRLAACVRETDTVSRLAGDEFVILLEGIHHEVEARQVAEKILTRLREPFNVEGQPVTMSTSIGIALYGGDNTTPEALLRRADGGLYEAKHLGRSRYQLVA